MKDLSRTETYFLGVVTIACLAILITTWRDDGEPLFASLAMGGIAFVFSYCLIVWTGDAHIERGYKGRDMSKKNPIEIPEFMGLHCALAYLLAMIIFIPFAFHSEIVEIISNVARLRELTQASQAQHLQAVQEAQIVDFVRSLHHLPLEKVRHHARVLSTIFSRLTSNMKLSPYFAAFGTLSSMVILGFLDDTFDMRWRHKFFIPAFAVLPVLALYFVSFGATHVVVPIPLRSYLGELIDLGALYYMFMAAVAIFCPNSINILAGVNGVEVGQSVVIAILIVLNDSLYLLPTVQQPHPAAESHLFSIYLLLPFIGASLALLKHNWAPARVFVGDTYCYFAGMLFAVVGILGHFSKTLMLLFLPQIFNFVYSAPQLFHIVPCPRHRLPRFNARTGLLEPSVATFPEEKPLRPIVGQVLKILGKVRLLQVKVDDGGRVVESSNFTILNLWLVWRGPLREDRLTAEILAVQTVCGLAGLWIRHSLGLLLFSVDNRF